MFKNDLLTFTLLARGEVERSNPLLTQPPTEARIAALDPTLANR